MKFIETNIEGVYIIELNPYSDERGIFSRIYCKKELQEIGINKDFVQANYSLTHKKGSVRGLHYQIHPKEEAKLIKCINGRVFDVAVDLRKNSSSFLQWVKIELSKENMKMIYIPEGCAHGFQTLEDNCELLYFHSEFYSSEHERTIYYKDDKINIQWPLETSEISDKDLKAEKFNEYFGV